MNEVTLLIGGKSIQAQDERTFDRIDPMKRNAATRSAAASVADVDLAVQSAAKAFESWASAGPG